jgi:hypothetical protein
VILRQVILAVHSNLDLLFALVYNRCLIHRGQHEASFLCDSIVLHIRFEVVGSLRPQITISEAAHSINIQEKDFVHPSKLWSPDLLLQSFGALTSFFISHKEIV